MSLYCVILAVIFRERLTSAREKNIRIQNKSFVSAEVFHMHSCYKDAQ